MKIPQTIEGKKLYFTEGVEIELTEFINLIKLKKSRFILHLKRENIQIMGTKADTTKVFHKDFKGMFILDSVPLIFTDDLGFFTFESLLKEKFNLKGLFTEILSEKEMKPKNFNEIERGEDRKANYELFKTIGDSLFSQTNKVEKQNSPPNSHNQIALEDSPGISENLKKIIRIRKIIQDLEDRLNQGNHDEASLRKIQLEIEAHQQSIADLLNIPNEEK